MDLTCQALMWSCSLQLWTLLLSPVTSIARCWYCFGSNTSFFLELFLHWYSIAYWAPNDLGSSSFSVISFCLYMLFLGFSRQEYRSGLPFPSSVDHILSELASTSLKSGSVILPALFFYLKMALAIFFFFLLLLFHTNLRTVFSISIKNSHWNFDRDCIEKLKVKVTHLCLSLLDTMDYTVHGIL